MSATTSFSLIHTRIDVMPLRDELARNSGAWALSTARQRNLPCQRETESIFLRKAQDDDPAVNVIDQHVSVDGAAAPYFPSALTWLRSVAPVLRGELGRALFAKLQPQGQVFRHVDAGAYYAIRHRYHLVIESREGSPMVCGDEEVVMREGELWCFDNKKPHEAFNHSSQPRVHLIFDLMHESESRVPGIRHQELP